MPGVANVSVDELRRPFFARAYAQRLIDHLGHLSQPVIFAGAGVSISRTGLTWDALVRDLMVNNCKVDEAIARKVVSALGPLRAASVVAQSYESMGLDRGTLSNDVRAMLYRNRDRLSGGLSAALASSWVAAAADGRPPKILTTNYDTHLEQDISEELALRIRTLAGAEPEEAMQQLARLEAIDSDGRGSVEYLHGRVSKAGGDPDDSPPVFSERDYFGASSGVEARLTEVIADQNLVIVGSGLTDPPLLNALLGTKQQAQDNGVRRVAFVRRGEIGAGRDDETAAAIMHQHEVRLHQYGLEGLYFDHYYQVAQFFSEMRIASTLGQGQYPDSAVTYSARLKEWWQNWQKDDLQSVQRDHHQQIREQLTLVKAALGAPDEDLKIEVWLRWNPETHREFRLWASSYAHFTSWKMARRTPIASDSPYVAVRSFCAGGLEYGPSRNEDEPDGSDRWKTFVGIPIRPNGAPDLVVGAVVLASMNPPTSSAISERNRGAQVLPFSKLATLASKLTNPDR